jgi:hypothetical protein
MFFFGVSVVPAALYSVLLLLWTIRKRTGRVRDNRNSLMGNGRNFLEYCHNITEFTVCIGY